MSDNTWDFDHGHDCTVNNFFLRLRLITYSLFNTLFQISVMG